MGVVIKRYFLLFPQKYLSLLSLMSHFLALIGKGSFSKVVRVSHRATGQKYAIKMIEKISPEGRESCERELRVLR